MKYLKRISCSFLAVALCMSIAAKDERGSTAKFDYFEYVGNDDFYRENPLPDDSSFYNPIGPGLVFRPEYMQGRKRLFHGHVHVYLLPGSSAIP